MKTKIDYSKFAISRDEIIWEIRQRCMKEMYAKAQPSEDYDKIWAYYEQCKKEGKDAERVYDRYYLSQEEFKYIEEKYLELYKLVNEFNDHCDILIRDLKDGYSKDKYIKEYTDKNGNWHPGYSSYSHLPSFEKQLFKYLKKKVIPESTAESLSKEIAKMVIKFIEDRKNFYRFNIDENKFRFNVTLADSPTSNPQTVIDYWKSQGKDIEIDLRKHSQDYFWSEENGYLEEEDYEKEPETIVK